MWEYTDSGPQPRMTALLPTQISQIKFAYNG